MVGAIPGDTISSSMFHLKSCYDEPGPSPNWLMESAGVLVNFPVLASFNAAGAQLSEQTEFSIFAGNIAYASGPNCCLPATALPDVGVPCSAIE
jgi:hypothetical protein